MMILNILLATLLAQRGTHSKLGDARESFGGALVNSSYPGSGRDHTEVYFPRGRSSEEFAISIRTTVTATGQNETAKIKYYLKGNGQARIVWQADLDVFALVAPDTLNDIHTGRPISMPKQIMASGTMLKILWQKGMKIHGTVGKTAEERLKVKEGYAGYGMRFDSSFHYWYFDRFGVFCGDHHFEVTAYKTPPPYPITKDELKDLN
jgi:hypothetical protein